MPAHHATNLAGRGNQSSPREELARQLFRQQVTGTIAWADLSPAEKATWYDLAEQSLHALANLGYRVEPSMDPADMQAAKDRTLALADDAAQQAEELLGMGEPLLAYNTLQKALVEQPAHLRLRQLKGLALARSGALQRANELLSALRDEGHADGETLGLLARTHKDLALLDEDDEQTALHLEAAYEIYATGYRKSKRAGAVDDAYYTGINAATMAFLHGDSDAATAIARDVEDLCEEALASIDDPVFSYWPQATYAEAALILGNLEVARDRYAAAARLAGSRYGNLSTTRQQAHLLLEHADASSAWLDEVMRVPPVLVYTGHMVDAPDRARPRFNPTMEADIRADIYARLDQLRPAAAYGSAACGADILCLECVRELGGELHIVLPFSVDEFRATSVDLREDGRWGERFERLLEDASEVLVVSEQPPAGCPSTFEYANMVMTGLARLRATLLDTRLHGLAVWDGGPSDDAGGTHSVVTAWRQSGVPFEHVQVGDSSTPAPPVAAPGTTADAERTWPFAYSIEAMLFADAVGYSRLSEQQIPLFFEHFTGAIASLNSTTEHPAIHMETAGDGIYMVFDDPGTAGLFALELSELINGRDWEEVGLPGDLGVRVGLHCGPVFVATDPITRQTLYTGVHTSRTARIEPITPPGQVYASSAFAAVATANDVDGLRFSYIGRTQLAKHYGVLPLYHVKRARRLS
jgi:class 3 adenylate cyclase